MAVEQLLRSSELPSEGVAAHFDMFLVAEDERARILGVVGLELYGTSALLRSLAVAAEARAQHLGSALARRAITLARDRGASAIYLLTTTASGFFGKHGFERIERSDVPVRVTTKSVEFTGVCADSAVVMRRRW